MADPAHPFDWHDHVEIGKGFNEFQRVVIERSLDDISKFADGDGQRLIAQAQNQNAGGKVQIIPAEQETDSNFKIGPDGNITPQVRISFPFQATLGVQTAEGVKPMSITATIVHELDHLATSSRGIEAQAEQTLLQQLHVKPDSHEAQKMLTTLRGMSRAVEVQEHTLITDMMLNPRAYEHSPNPQMRHLASELMSTSVVENAEALQREGIISKQQRAVDIARVGNAISQQEEDAAGYTHALIERNYGNTTATPVNYMDARGMSSHPVGALPEPTQAYATQGFEPTHYSVGDLGELPAPSVPKMPAGPGRGQNQR